ncbi:carboxylesterase family protein [Aspergillus pseudoustus]|uniref:Carboxylesterase family protein n=1 Tax=Aspergillus pseudoustus TaxID=1810923 RepID=A0ABR4KYP1_9EURO
MLVLGTLFALAAASAPALTLPANIGVAFEPGNDLPLLKLPYGTWRARQHDHKEDVYTFRNIRYAAPPIGKLRWSKPAGPDKIYGIQDGSYGPNCIQAPIPEGFFMPGLENLSRNAAEDCLFLDVYVPGEVLRKRQSKVPVVVWIHGGAFVSGSKDQAVGAGYYNGTSLIHRADNNLIIISINYRLGAFGFLAGKPLHDHGTFNAGLHDQRAALSWVQKYIHLLGGDPDNISAWGQSAGAGSLIYHLIAEGGKLDPLFRRVVLQSPAFETNANIQTSYKRFEEFAEAVGCPSKGEEALRCLRSANSTALKNANEQVFLGISSPVPDGRHIQSPALVEYAKGNTWKQVDSVIISHVLDEGTLSIRDPVPEGQLQGFIVGSLPPNSSAQANKITNLFESLYANATEKKKLSAVYTYLFFTCNLRAVLNSYQNTTWSFQYSFLDGDINGMHASDMPATWYTSQAQDKAIYNGTVSEPLFSQFQRYLTNHARTGNPNMPGSRNYELKHWPKVSGLHEDVPRNVLNMHNAGFELISDEQMSKRVCDAWTRALVEAVEGLSSR